MNALVGSLTSVRRAIAQVAVTNATVLILGETGTGKELVARAIHEQSRRASSAFVAVNCGAMVSSLVASELFGHEAGAFTGAVKRRIGRFEQAHGGTLVLDEVGELAPDVQAMLLRVLQERTIERLGSSEAVRVDVRLITATHRDLAADVRSSGFRADLFYRLNVFPITLPPLRERKADLPALAAHFLERFAKQHTKPACEISPRMLRLLESHDWPGNVRELQNVIERAVIISDGEELAIDPAWLVPASSIELATCRGEAPRCAVASVELATCRGEAPRCAVAPIETARTWAEQEKARILTALRAANGRIYGPGGAAQRLGLKPTTLYGKMRKHGLKREADWL